MLSEAIVGVEQMLPKEIRLNTMYIHRRGRHALRGVNVNAPLADGSRPDPSAGPITGVSLLPPGRRKPRRFGSCGAAPPPPPPAPGGAS